MLVTWAETEEMRVETAFACSVMNLFIQLLYAVAHPSLGFGRFELQVSWFMRVSMPRKALNIRVLVSLK